MTHTQDSPQPRSAPGVDADTLLAHGRRLVLAGSAAKALRVFQFACVRSPLDGAAWVGLGHCQQELGQVDAALVSFSMARALGVEHPGLLVAEAECSARLGG